MKKIIFILLIYTGLALSATGQSDYSTSMGELIFVHTDRDIYTAGENLYYAMYLKSGGDRDSRFAYLLLQDQKTSSAVILTRLEIKEKKSFGSIYLPDTLGTGYYQLVSYTNLMRNSEETIFKKEIIIVNRFDEKLTSFDGAINKSEPALSEEDPDNNSENSENLMINLEKQNYRARDTISFTFEPKYFDLDPASSLSVSVSEIFPGSQPVRSITNQFRRSGQAGLRKGAKEGKIRFIPEFSNPVVQGKITFPPGQGRGKDQPGTKTSKEKKSYTVYLSSPDSVPNLQYTRSDSTGSFYFQLNPWYEGKELFIRLREEENAALEIDDKISLPGRFIPAGKYNLPGIKEYLLRCSKIVQIQRYYTKRNLADTLGSTTGSYIAPRVYNKKYLTIYPEDYLELPDFQEISREILPSFKIRKVRGEYVSDYSNLQYQAVNDDEPLIFLDGVPIDDVSQIITLGSKDIKSIETIPVMRYYGGLIFNGILAVKSRNSAIDNVKFKLPAVKFRILPGQPFTRPQLFKPEYVPPHYPDMRQLLLWDPDFRQKNPERGLIRCYSSDIGGTFRITIQGITPGGDPVYGTAEFSVELK